MASTQLSRNPTQTGSRQIFTYSFWIKKTTPVNMAGVTPEQGIVVSRLDSSNGTMFRFNADDTFSFKCDASAGTKMDIISSRVFRDPAAWMHFVLAVDTTQSTDTNRVKIYVNGVQETSFGTANYPSQNQNLEINEANNQVFYVGSNSSSIYFNGLMSYVAFVDGTAYDASYFGETNAATGIWTINISPSVTYGTNGFFLKMDTSSPGSDTSGNNNTFTASGTPTLAQDNPDNNFCTMNILDDFWQSNTFSNGNNTVVTSNGNYARNSSTIGMSTGKWYSEYKVGSITGSGGIYIGITGDLATGTGGNTGNSPFSYAYASDGTRHFNGASSSFGDSYTTGDIIGVALDATNYKLWWSKNGVWQGSGDPSNGSNPAYTVVVPSSTTIGAYFWSFSDNNSGEYFTCDCNFGNGFFGVTAVASSNADAAGHGLFEYAVPTGFFTLNTKNLNTYGG
jgi:hypothetical protein